MLASDLDAVTFDNLPSLTVAYDETEGVGAHRGRRYRKATLAATAADGVERWYAVQVCDDGKRTVRAGKRTPDQRHREAVNRWWTFSPRARCFVKEHFRDLTRHQQNVLAAMADGKPVEPLAVRAVVDGAARRVFFQLFPAVATVEDAYRAMFAAAQAYPDDPA